jgi:hypothetical protein
MVRGREIFDAPVKVVQRGRDGRSGSCRGPVSLYRLYIDHLTEWDVFTVLAVIALIKISMMIYYRFRG